MRSLRGGEGYWIVEKDDGDFKFGGGVWFYGSCPSTDRQQ
jgi:hypothetical protein